MREYGKVGPGFWTGMTGRKLRGDPDAQIVAMYLITCPHASMIGVFHCPVMYIAHDTGLPLEGALKGLRRLAEEGFCTFDEERDLVWVHEMARFQISDALLPTDNRVKGIGKDFLSLPKCLIKQRFFEKYRAAFHLPELPGNVRGFEGASEPLRSQEQEQEQEQKKDSLSERGSDFTSKPKRKIAYSEPFEAFWSDYPRTPNMSKSEAFDEWKKLDADDQASAHAALPAFKAFLKTKPDLEVQHACRFLKKRRFEGFNEAVRPAVTSDDGKWPSRLQLARQRKVWSTPQWGPPPGRPGCRVPPPLIETGDGTDWSEWEQAA
jgi:hypothetical protein